MICSFQCNISMQKLKEAVALTQTHTTNWIGYKIIVCLETIRGPGTQRNLNEINSQKQRSLHRYNRFMATVIPEAALRASRSR